MPSIESQKYASYKSKIGHINCKTGDDLKNLFESLSPATRVQENLCQ